MKRLKKSQKKKKRKSNKSQSDGEQSDTGTSAPVEESDAQDPSTSANVAADATADENESLWKKGKYKILVI